MRDEGEARARAGVGGRGRAIVLIFAVAAAVSPRAPRARTPQTGGERGKRRPLSRRGRGRATGHEVPPGRGARPRVTAVAVRPASTIEGLKVVIVGAGSAPAPPSGRRKAGMVTFVSGRDARP